MRRFMRRLKTVVICLGSLTSLFIAMGREAREEAIREDYERGKRGTDEEDHKAL